MDSSFLLAGYMKQVFIQDEVAAVAMRNPQELSPNEAHHLFGYHNKNRTREIAKALGIVLTKGPMEVCKSCAIAKAKQKNTTHDTSSRGNSTTYNDKVYLDLSFVFGPNKKRAYKYMWHLMVDSATGYGTEGFYKAKNNFIEPACRQLQKWKNDGKEAKINQQDNAGDKKLFEERAGNSNWTLGAKFEYTTRATLQHNSIVKLGFAACAQLARAMFKDANMDADCQTQLEKGCLSLANKYCNLAVIEYQDQQMTR